MNKQRRGFLGLLERYINGSASSEEKEVMDVWYNALDKDTPKEKSTEARQELESKIWEQIQAKKQSEKQETIVLERKWWNMPFLKLASAASVLFVLGFLYFFSDSRKATDKFATITSGELALLSRLSNSGSSKQVIRLADGSHVTLNAGATLYYPKNFDTDKRVVYLEGDGYFDIRKNPSKPFLLYTAGIVTKVLGTSFTINSSGKSGNVEVAVITGRVIVEKADGSSTDFSKTTGVLLTPNKKVTFLHASDQYVTGLVDKPVLVEHAAEFQKPDAFVFEEALLSTVVEKLEKAYGVEIEIENRSILNCPITADLSDESMFVKLEIINALLGTKSDVKETSVVLSGGECPPFKSSVN